METLSEMALILLGAVWIQKKGVTALQECKKTCRLEIAWRQTQRNPNALKIPNAQLATRFGLSFIRKCGSSPRPAPNHSSRQGGVRRRSQPWLGKATFAGGLLVSWVGTDCICHVLGFSFHKLSGGGFQHCSTMQFVVYSVVYSFSSAEIRLGLLLDVAKSKGGFHRQRSVLPSNLHHCYQE